MMGTLIGILFYQSHFLSGLEMYVNIVNCAVMIDGGEFGFE